MNYLPEPITRVERYLARIAGNTDVSIPEKPITRKEHYLAAWAEKSTFQDITVTGNPAVLDNATGKPFKGLHIYGRSEQMTTTGAQLLDASLFENTSSVSVKCNGSDIIITALTDGPYRQTSSAPIGFFEEGDQICIAAEAFPKDNVAIIRDSSGVTIANVPISNGLQEAVTIPANGTYRIILCINKGVSVKAGTVGVFSKLIVNKGNVSKDYEPYTGGKPSPSPEYPQEIQSAGDDGNISVIVKNPDNEQMQSVPFSTPNGLPGIPVSANGNYTDSNGQQWVCDELDFERGVYRQWIKHVNVVFNKVVSPAIYNGYRHVVTDIQNMSRKHTECLCNIATYSPNASTNASNGTEGVRASGGYNTIVLYYENLTNDNVHADVAYILSDPIETTLTAAEIAAYKSLRTYRGTTIVEAEDKAGISVTYTKFKERSM